MAQHSGLFGMQIWGIWRNGPNESEGNFAFYAEEHGLGEMSLPVTRAKAREHTSGRPSRAGSARYGRRSAHLGQMGTRGLEARAPMGKGTAMHRAFAMRTKRVYFCNEDEAGTLRLPVTAMHRTFAMRTKRGASSPSHRNASSFCNEDETGSFRLPAAYVWTLMKESFIIASTRARALHRSFAFPLSPFTHHGGGRYGCGYGMNG